eukprot:gene10825-7553_t
MYELAYPALSFISRNALCCLYHRTGYQDADIVNCHPAHVFQWLVDRNGRPLTQAKWPHFSWFCTQRGEAVAAVQRHYGVREEDAKRLFQTLLNDGTLRGWRERTKTATDHDPAWLGQLREECQDIITEVIDHPTDRAKRDKIFEAWARLNPGPPNMRARRKKAFSYL